MTWADSLVANYTDGIVILHRGRIVYERYFGALTSERAARRVLGDQVVLRHDRGHADRGGQARSEARVARYIPELAASGFGDATVAQVLDMTTAIDFIENYVGESPSMEAYRAATGFVARAPDATGPSSIYAFLPTIEKEGKHGEAFTLSHAEHRRRGLADRARDRQAAAEVLSERIWSRIGAEDDAFLQVDAAGTPAGRQQPERALARLRSVRRNDASRRPLQRPADRAASRRRRDSPRR